MEIWKPIPGIDKYFASNLGRIKHTRFKSKEKIRKISTNTHGYSFISIAMKNVYVHRLVFQAFVRPLEKREEINHLNGIKSDNRLENLEAVSHQENVIHAYKTGLMKQTKGINHHLWATRLPFALVKRVNAARINQGLEWAQLMSNLFERYLAERAIAEGKAPAENVGYKGIEPPLWSGSGAKK